MPALLWECIVNDIHSIVVHLSVATATFCHGITANRCRDQGHVPPSPFFWPGGTIPIMISIVGG